MQFNPNIPKKEKDYTLYEMIEMAKKSEFGCVWLSEKGPIKITKEGKLEPILSFNFKNEE